MNDRELLELAAKAAGIALGEWVNNSIFADQAKFAFSASNLGTQWYWNPLEDDGDALRLAVKLQLEICIHENDTRVIGGNLDTATEQHGVDPAAATRRAIVRAAAELAKSNATESRQEASSTTG